MPLSSDNQFIAYRALVGQVIASKRQLKRMPQKDLAKAMGVNPASLSRLETGESIPTVEQIALIASLLDDTAGNIVTEADNAASRLQAQGFMIVHSPSDAPSGLQPLGAAVLGGLLVAMFTQGKK